jgi:hypothetical protein
LPPAGRSMGSQWRCRRKSDNGPGAIIVAWTYGRESIECLEGRRSGARDLATGKMIMPRKSVKPQAVEKTPDRASHRPYLTKKPTKRKGVSKKK